MAAEISIHGPEDQSKVQRIYGPERRVSLKDQPRGAWKEQQAADYLSRKVGTLRNWRHMSKGPKYYKCGRSIVYRQEDLDAFMEQCAVNPVA